jgi:hypothetical protein
MTGLQMLPEKLSTDPPARPSAAIRPGSDSAHGGKNPLVRFAMPYFRRPRVRCEYAGPSAPEKLSVRARVTLGGAIALSTCIFSMVAIPRVLIRELCNTVVTRSVRGASTRVGVSTAPSLDRPKTYVTRPPGQEEAFERGALVSLRSWLDFAGDSIFELLFRVFQFESGLKVNPELRSGAEVAAQAQRRIRTHSARAFDNRIDATARNPQRQSQCV